MRYPVVIEKGDENTAYGVVFPDFSGCFSAGDTLDEALENAREAASMWLEEQIVEGLPIPKPSTLESLENKEEFQGWIRGFVDVDASQLSDKVERINITIPRRVLTVLDAKAKSAGISRSGYIAEAVLMR